ncbi:MAG: GAF domain-containing sensor histidine kinase [Syntrophaceae bacterium]|nr:GAF domain-containing sensor histidine kinase [Syntrophaceae bacterium]
MSFWEIDPQLVQQIGLCLAEKGINLPDADLPALADRMKNEILDRYVDRIIRQVETILEIDPRLSEKEILRSLGRNIVQFLGADFASIRIYDSFGEGETSFPYSPLLGKDILELTPFDKAIADEVIKTQRSYQSPNIFKDPNYQDEEKAREIGIHSMLAVPISLPRFTPQGPDTQGVLQVFYKQEDKVFSPYEVQMAEVLSRRVEYVIARKRILSMQKINLARDKILEDIYLRLARREGIKMKDVFNRVIPALADFMKIQRCTLFSVLEDREHVCLEAGFPGAQHGIGKIFSADEPYIRAILKRTGPFGDFENEKVHPSYILITNPQMSHLLPAHLKNYLASQQINCVLYIPLEVDGVVQYFLAFDAQAHHQQFAEDEIMVFSFLGKELMKGLRLEKMGDILHDFKNPAIAIAGFAKRLDRILSEVPDLPKKEKVQQALEIILEESSRIQALALTLHGEGKETTLDMSDILKRRCRINEEAIREIKRENRLHIEKDLKCPLWVRCFPLHIERVFDNLLNNASQATPDGGELVIRCYPKSAWAVAEITNTGEISEEEKERCLLGESRGRGLHITTRLVKHMDGKIEVESLNGRTTFRIELPLAPSPA